MQIPEMGSNYAVTSQRTKEDWCGCSMLTYAHVYFPSAYRQLRWGDCQDCGKVTILWNAEKALLSKEVLSVLAQKLCKLAGRNSVKV